MATKKPTRKSTRPKKTREAKVAASEPERPAEAVQPARRWNIGRLFLGLLFITVGVLFLLHNFNVIDVSFGNVFRLWPLLIIAVGVSMLSLRGRLAAIISALLVIGTLALVIAVAVGNWEWSRHVTTTKTTIEREQDITDADVLVRAGAGKITVLSNDQAAVASATLTSNVTNLEKNTSREGGTQSVELVMGGGGSDWWRGGNRNELQIDLAENLPLDLMFDTGAADVDLQLAETMLKSLNIDAGASRIDIKLGDLFDEQQVTIQAGASSVHIRVPRTVGVRVTVDGGLTSRDLADLQDMGGGRYESSGYDQSLKKINITADMGLAGFKLSRY